MNEVVGTNLAWNSSVSNEAVAGAQPDVSELQNSDDRVLAVTRDLFVNTATIEEECDPSFPEYRWRVISVTQRGTSAELLAKEALWHQRLQTVLGAAAARYSLCVYPE